MIWGAARRCAFRLRRIRFESWFWLLLAVHLQNSYLLSLSFRVFLWNSTCLTETFRGFNREIMCVKKSLINYKSCTCMSIHFTEIGSPLYAKYYPQHHRRQKLKEYSSFSSKRSTKCCSIGSL